MSPVWSVNKALLSECRNLGPGQWERTTAKYVIRERWREKGLRGGKMAEDWWSLGDSLGRQKAIHNKCLPGAQKH